MSDKTPTVIVLGAGASRAASYADDVGFPSPLDSDFFHLLKRLEVSDFPEKDPRKVKQILEWCDLLPEDCQHSFERAFYTLQTKAYLLQNFTSKPETHPTDSEVVAAFATGIQVVLRKAHGIHTCDYHKALFDELGCSDTIISFNYDLVAERALRDRAQLLGMPFSPRLYSLTNNGSCYPTFPTLLKLHGSSNWRLVGDGRKEQITVNTKQWSDLDRPSYRGYWGTGTRFPIFLPFWDKRIEKGPWLPLWRTAYKRLKQAQRVVIWGYSLPTTDIKAQQLFRLSLGDKSFRLCVIDPSLRTRNRWRDLFPKAEYLGRKAIQQFLRSWAS